MPRRQTPDCERLFGATQKCLRAKPIWVPLVRTIEPSGAQHKKLRAAFSYGVEALDRYLKQQASQDAKKRAAVPCVLGSADNRIAGYYTLSADNIRVERHTGRVGQATKPAAVAGDWRNAHRTIGRDLAFRRQGVGELLLLDALKRALGMSKQIASAAVVVDAKNKRRIAFIAHLGLLRSPKAANRLFLPMQTIEQLFWHPHRHHAAGEPLRPKERAWPRRTLSRKRGAQQTLLGGLADRPAEAPRHSRLVSKFYAPPNAWLP